MKPLKLHNNRLFSPGNTRTHYPDQLSLNIDIKKRNATIDVIIAGYGQPEMTNTTVQNYLMFEQKADIHLIIIESSNNPEIHDQIIDHPKISRIFFKEDHKITYNNLGYASPALALSFSVGSYFSNAEYVFFSHNDMIAYRKNFLSFLKSKLTNGIRLASFTQRHLIPFTGCMMVHRDVLLNPEADWAPKPNNRFIAKGNPGYKALQKLTNFSASVRFKQFPKAMRWIDCGEDYVYHELSHNNPVYVVASVGGADDYGKHPFKYSSQNISKVQKIIKSSDIKVYYAENTYSKRFIEQNYPELIEAVVDKNTGERKDRYWRVSFDDTGQIIFLHRGRGNSLQNCYYWLHFSKSLMNGK